LIPRRYHGYLPMYQRSFNQPKTMNWYYAEAGQQIGPIDEAQFEGLIRDGKIQEETLVWNETLDNWRPYGEVRAGGAVSTVPAAAGAPPTGNQATCAECGGLFDSGDMIRHGEAWVCARCKPVFLQKLAEGAAVSTGGLNYAGFWIRFCAKFVDGLLVGIVFIGPMIALMVSPMYEQGSGTALLIEMGLQLGWYVVYGAYAIFFVGKYGATPGKMACKLIIVDGTGARIGYGRATGRFFAEILSGLICYIGYLLAVFDPERRSLHDRICNTRVVYR
jgi:uncharacterized RDD family membrane protein YckC